MDAAKVLLFAWFWTPAVLALVLLLARSVERVTAGRHRTDGRTRAGDGKKHRSRRAAPEGD